MNEAKEWAAYVAQINAVEVAKATSKNLMKKKNQPWCLTPRQGI